MLYCFALMLGLFSASTVADTDIHILSTADVGDPWVSDLVREIRIARPQADLHLEDTSDHELDSGYWIATDAQAATQLDRVSSEYVWLAFNDPVTQRPEHELLAQSANLKTLIRVLSLLTPERQVWLSEQARQSPWYGAAIEALSKHQWRVASQPTLAAVQLLLDPSESARLPLAASPWKHHLGRQAQLGGSLDGQKMGEALVQMLDQPKPEVPRMLTLIERHVWIDNRAMDAAGLAWSHLGDAVRPLDYSYLQDSDGEHFVVTSVIGAIALVIIFGLLAKILGQRRAKARVDHLITSDRLTGLLNREGFIAKVDARLEAAPHSVHGLVVCEADLPSNLTNADQDRLIQQISERLRGNARQTELLGRIGAHEFAVLIEGTHLDELGLQMEKYCESLRLPVFIGEHPYTLSANLGAALWPDHASNATATIELARQAARFAGQISDVSWSLYNPHSEDPIERNRAMLDDLKHAMKNGELNLVYQPIVKLSDQSIVGVESLLRWQHPTLGAISPPDIISMARDGGLIGSLGEWVLQSAVAQAVRWQHMGLDIKVNVNVAPEQFSDPRFVPQIQQLLFETGLPSNRLTLEVTEDATINNPAQAKQALARLHSIGVGSAIDDFGTGYSSLSRLKEFKLDALKIDRSFVMDLDEDNNDRAINRAIIQIAHSMSLSVVAEGIETQEQLMLLINEGCDYGQGYLFSKPVEAQQIHALMNRLPEAKLA